MCGRLCESFKQQQVNEAGLLSSDRDKSNFQEQWGPNVCICVYDIWIMATPYLTKKETVFNKSYMGSFKVR